MEYARELDMGQKRGTGGIVGLPHDIDFELYPAEHCLESNRASGVEGGGRRISFMVSLSHGYGITIECGVTLDVEPVHEMEKVCFCR